MIVGAEGDGFVRFIKLFSTLKEKHISVLTNNSIILLREIVIFLKKYLNRYLRNVRSRAIESTVSRPQKMAA